MTRRWRGWTLGLVALTGIVAALFVPALPQDPAYHAFADTRTILNVPHFWNVFSNAGFALVGIYGLIRLSDVAPSLRVASVVFCVAVIGVSVGSAHYHHAPSTPALVWDRLPMSVAFMALFALVLGDRVSWWLGRALLWPLMIAGAASVGYWAWTERQRMGDLRLYGVAQFLPMIVMPLMLLLYPGSRRTTPWLWSTLAIYLLAKAAEYLDAPLYDVCGLSGHTIKHWLSSVAVLCAVVALRRLDPPRSRPGQCAAAS